MPKTVVPTVAAGRYGNFGMRKFRKIDSLSQPTSV